MFYGQRVRSIPAAVSALLLTATAAFSAQFVVTNTNDSGPGSLRQAMDLANATPNGQSPDEIDFNLAGSGVHSIVLASELPEITDPVTINGWSQLGWNGAPLIELVPTQGLSANGLTLSGGTTTLRGLVLGGFNRAILIKHGGFNTIQGCYIGTNSSGTSANPNYIGINPVVAGPDGDLTQFSNLTIGGTSQNERNIISGNTAWGIADTGQGSNIIIRGNYIGTDKTGTIAIPNHDGIILSADQVTIGGVEAGAGNLISGNSSDGLELAPATFAAGSGNVVLGNRIGTTADGASALGNGLNGISGLGIIGGTSPGAGNLISGNAVGIRSGGATIQGNFIGTDITGKIAIPNSRAGISGSGTFGGTTPGAGNLISGNAGPGIQMEGVSYGFGGPPPSRPGGVIQGNLIGTDISGKVKVPNQFGILVSNGNNVVIGGSIAGSRNVISGNTLGGIEADFTNVVQIMGNFIGTLADGKTPLGNGGNGIQMRVDWLNDYLVGAANWLSPQAGNVIAFNAGPGVLVALPNAASSTHAEKRISANSIHDNGSLGIDVTPSGVTPNDPQESSGNASNPQNYPVVSAAFAYNGQLTIYGSLNSKPNTAFLLEFFANFTADPTGYGEGEQYLGQAQVTTNSSGDAQFNVRFPLPANASTVTATATNSIGETSEFSADMMVSSTAPTSPPVAQTAVSLPLTGGQLLNISTRVQVQTGYKVAIAGFIVTGSVSKKVIVRGIGPSLTGAGVPGVLADPVLELHDGSGNLLTTNDNWKTDQQAEIEASGVPPTNDLESAIVWTLAPGNYTAILRGKDNTSGVGLVEAYDLARSAASRLANISTRGFVSTADDVMIGGFIVGSNTGAITGVVVRALGPSLTSFGLSALPDPILELRDGNGSLVQANDDWQAENSLQIAATGLQPSDSHESAIAATLAAGNYTAIVRGKNNTTGIALVEVYNVGN